MRKALKAAALLTLLAAALTAPAAERTSSRTVESITFDQKTTSKKKYDLRVHGSGARVRLHVRASVREGELKFVVRDAAGKVRQDVSLTPSKSRPSNYNVDSGEVQSAAGLWTVEVELRDAVGSYEFTWTTE
jgi:hypothetical protein